MLLFVDDDPVVLQYLAAHFRDLGYGVATAADGQEALRVLSSAALECVILDIDMPGADGFEVCRRLRETSRLPVIFLSCLTEDDTRIRSFLVGGDDYLAKPFHIKELELRIRARIRHPGPHTEAPVLLFGALIIDTGLRSVTYLDRQGDFTTTQFDVLAFLARHPGQVFSYEQIYDRVWKSPLMGSKHNLQVVMATVRQKLAALCEGRSYIQTVPRKGYRFAANPSRSG